MQRIRLALDAGLEGLQPVAAAEEADDGDVDVTLVERSGRAVDAGGNGGSGHQRSGDEAAEKGARQVFHDQYPHSV
ncbi:hypothetical protein D3C87_1738150 [compost metagenome]